MVDLESEMDISSIKVYNRANCCPDRLNGAKLQCLSSDNTVLFETILRSDYNIDGRGHDVEAMTETIAVSLNATESFTNLFDFSQSLRS